MGTNRRYFKCFKFVDGETKIEYYRTSTPTVLIDMFDFIQPLGYKKPANIKREEIKET